MQVEVIFDLQEKEVPLEAVVDMEVVVVEVVLGQMEEVLPVSEMGSN